MIKTCNCEDFPCCGHGESYDPQAEYERFMETQAASFFEPDEMDEINTREANDYRNEDEADETPLGMDYGDGFDMGD